MNKNLGPKVLTLISCEVFRYLPYMVMRIALYGIIEDIRGRELKFGTVPQSILEDIYKIE